MQKIITILGSTGSIGTQSLDVVQKQNYKVFGLSAHKNIDLLEKQVEMFMPQVVAVTDEASGAKLLEKWKNKNNMPKLLIGENAAETLASMQGATIVLNAIVGIAGLKATLAAIQTGKDVALANKESLVTGGRLVMDAVQQYNVKLLPVDSEHSAIFQCLQDTYSAKTLKKIYLTASGGPFFGYTKEQLVTVTKEDALKHPNWEMGAKITIDSATMMNKGLEFIEAMWLFDVKPEQIEILVHRQSIIHSMVEFDDNAILAQLGTPDMHIPIQYALTWPSRFESNAAEVDFTQISNLTFAGADDATFLCLKACKKAINKGGLYPCAANGANEAAVALFLEDKIPFLQIGELVMGAVDFLQLDDVPYNLENVFEIDKIAREYVYTNSVIGEF